SFAYEGLRPEHLKPGWRDRLRSLANIPPLFRLVWASAPDIVALGTFFRVAAALVPLAILMVTRAIIDALHSFVSHSAAPSHSFWYLVILEGILASAAMVLARLIAFCDTVLADRFNSHVNVRIIEHASRMELSAYENPQFYDQLE